MIPVDSRCFVIQNHSNQAFQVMQEMRCKEDLCDVTLEVEGVTFQVHRVVLASCSPILRAMFTNGMQETDQDVIQLRGIEADTMSLMLDFMYTGSVEVSTETVEQLLQGATLLQLVRLKKACCQFLQHHLHASNCLDLEVSSRRYICRHFLDVIHSEEFLRLSEKQLFDLIKSDQLQVNQEEEVFEAALKWIQWDPRSRSSTDVMCKILQHIRLALLDITYLEEKVLQHDLINRCVSCQAFVSVAMRTKNDNSALATIANRASPLGIYVIGGRNVVDSQLCTVERYNVAKDSWTPMVGMQAARTALGVTVSNGLLYAVSGECAVNNQPLPDDTSYLDSVEAYDSQMKTWQLCASMHVPRSFVAVVSNAGYIYALGGEDKTKCYNVVERYCCTSDSWSFIPSMKQKRAGAGATMCDGKLYVAGGFDKTISTDRASVECYDPDTQEWSFVAEMETPRSGLILVAIDHYLYAIGGKSRYHQYYSNGERYNTLTGQWSNIASMQFSRAWAGAVSLDGKLYVMGGFDGQLRLRRVECYDPETDDWSSVSAMSTPRAGCGAAVF